MALPPAFLDELRDRVNLSDIAGCKVTWDQRKSNRAKGDFWAPCPFHQEKTPSFHVEDRKGRFYCFGCQEKGSLFDFVMKTDNLSFIEAVELVAREAGVEMPARTHDPRAAERRDRAGRLADVMEAAVRFFGLAFRSGAGSEVRDYVQERGLTPETLKTFEIGFAPDSRTQVTEHFRGKGTLDDAVDAGLVIVPDDGGAPYDRFRNRLMFPIRDQRGRCIAFGGRAMSAHARAKYLNSPETELFHKGRTLYNHGPAREAAGKVQSLIVAEGYMDVIALAQAGFAHAVAPLGTAITEDQLGLIWKITDEPVIALDGDTAGLRAAERLIDLALPMLAPGRSLRFCLMPEGQDPDDVVRHGGPGAMRAALDAAVPLVEMLWRRETAAAHDTPERRAALDQRLRASLARIADPGVRSHYAADLRQRRSGLFGSRHPERFGPSKSRRGGGFLPPKRQRPAVETLGSELARRRPADAAARVRESAILLIALRNPAALEQIEGSLAALHCTTPELDRILAALLGAIGAEDVSGRIAAEIGADPVAILEAAPQARAHPMARGRCEPAAVARVLEEAIDRHQACLAHATELGDARRDLAYAEDERWSARLQRANLERLAADLRATAVETPAEETPSDSGIQKLLDAEAWRRAR